MPCVALCRGAGVPPAIFLISMERKTAGETPVPRKTCISPIIWMNYVLPTGFNVGNAARKILWNLKQFGP